MPPEADTPTETDEEQEHEPSDEDALAGPCSRFVEREPRRFNISALVWEAAPPLESFAPATVRLIHDAEDLYVRYTDGQAFTDDDQLVVDLRPAGREAWRIIVNADGSVECRAPTGIPVAPHCRARFERDASGPRVLLSVPFCEFVKPGEVGGTPLSGETWGFAVRRVAGGKPAAAELIEITFVGGPRRRRIELLQWDEPFFGVSLIKLKAETSKPKGVNAVMWPSPAEYLRTKDPAHVKFRIAKAGAYRLRLRLPKEPDIETAEDEEPEPGEASYAGGTVFVLPEIWDDLVAMENDINRFRRAAKEQHAALADELSDNIEFFADLVNKSDGYRMPGCREKMEPSFFELVKNIYADVRSGFEAVLPAIAADHPRVVQATGLDMDAVLAAGRDDDAADESTPAS